jgi:hypothetical protein
VKLSLKKRWGFIHVRGGRVLRVAKEHAVRCDTRSRNADHFEDFDGIRPSARGQPQGDAKWVTAQVGDLAIEIIVVKTGKVLGHSYLSGPAIQLNRYTPFDPAWFREGKSRLLEIVTPQSEKEAEALIDTLVDARLGDDDVVAIVHRAENDNDAKAAAGALHRYARLQRKDDQRDLAAATAHLVGLIFGRGKFRITLHFQPERDASDYAAADFQIPLALTAHGVKV